MTLILLITFFLFVVCSFIFSNLVTIYCIWSRQNIRYSIPPNGKEKVLYITIDDVPCPNDDPLITYSIVELIDILRKYDACATLFVIGGFLAAAPVTVLRKLGKAVKDGTVALANHGMTNTKHCKKTGEELSFEIDGCKKEMEWKFGDVMLNAYRPGSGKISRPIMNEAKKRNLIVTLGNIYTFDAQITSSLFHLLIISLSIRPGSILIIHDRSWTPWLLDRLLWILAKRGYKTALLPK